MLKCPGCSQKFDDFNQLWRHIEAANALGIVGGLEGKLIVVEELLDSKTKKTYHTCCDSAFKTTGKLNGHISANHKPYNNITRDELRDLLQKMYRLESQPATSSTTVFHSSLAGPSRLGVTDSVSIDLDEGGLNRHSMAINERRPLPDRAEMDKVAGFGSERVPPNETDQRGSGRGCSGRTVRTEDQSLAGYVEHGDSDSQSEKGSEGQLSEPEADQRCQSNANYRMDEGSVEIEPESLTEETTAFLWHWGLGVNDELRILICWTCGHAVEPTPSGALSHIQKRHAKRETTEKPSSELLSKLEVLKSYPFAQSSQIRVQPQERTPIPGITVERGYYCPLLSEDGKPCCAVCLKESSFYEHLKSHPTKSSPPKRGEFSNYTCECQTLFNSKKRKYFRVKAGPVEVPEHPVNPYTLFLQREASTLKEDLLETAEAFKHEELPSLLRATQWHVFVESYKENPEDVVKLIEHPQPSQSGDSPKDLELAKLPQISEAWLADVNQYWKGSSERMRRVLTGNPIKHDLWNWVQNDSTKGLYARTLTKFTAASIRSLDRDQSRFRLPLTENVRRKAMSLVEALSQLPSESKDKGKQRVLSKPSNLTSGPLSKQQRRPEEEVAILKLQEFFFCAVTDSAKESQHNRFECPVLAYIACFGYNEDNTFKDASQVTSMLAQWQFLLRCTALHYAHVASDVNTEGLSVLRILEDHCEVHIREGNPSVFDSVQQTQAIASTIAFNQPHSATICWSQDHEVLQYKKHQIKISSLTGGVQTMLEDLLEKMYAFSGGDPVEYIIPKDHVDDLTSTGRGLSWLQGCHTVPESHGLMDAMVKKGLWKLSFADEKNELRWNRVACQEFMTKAAQIVDLIIVLVHLGTGPPLRGEELIRDQITNGVQARTIYLVFGQMMAIRRRSKDTNTRGIDSFNVCYFPRSLTKAICYYLVVIRPLECVVARQLYQDQRWMEYNLSLYVKHGRRMKSEEFSETLSKLTGHYMGANLSIQPLRHIMIAFQRAFVEPKVVDKGNNIGDLISSHSSRTADRYYAREYDDLEGATSNYLLDVQDWCDLYHEAIGLGERKGPLVPLRTKRKVAQQLLTLASMDSGDPHAVNLVSDILKQLGETAYRAGLEELKSHATKEIWQAVSNGFEQTVSDRGFFPSPPLQTPLPPHPPKTPASAGTIPPIETRHRKRQLSSPRNPISKRKNTPFKGPPRHRRFSSEESHSQETLKDMDLECASDSFEPAPDFVLAAPNRPPILPNSQRDQIQLTAETEVLPSSRPLPGSSKHALLLKLRNYRHDPVAEFKSMHQQLLLESVMSRSYTIGVMPTGAGKSIAYELPPTFQKQVTIVAIPYRAIISQVVQNAKKNGISAEVWHVKTPRNLDSLRLVIMPFDSILTKEFIRWIGENHTLISMIVVDEAHVILCSKKFREVMNNFPSLIECKVPLTLLTATLPPRMERSLVEACNLPASYNMIRAPSDRKEHRYEVVGVDRGDLVQDTLNFVNSSTNFLKGDQRGIIFARTKDSGEEIKNGLPGAELITGDTKGDEARDRMITEWKMGQSGKWIIGTSCLIHGIDYPDVHLVVFAGSPWGMVDFVQGAGRGGRNGSSCRVVLIRRGQDQALPDAEDMDMQCKKEMVAWVKNTTECRRLGISQCMDGGNVTCRSLEGAVFCDVCAPDPITDLTPNTPTAFPRDSTHFSQAHLPPPTNPRTQPLAQPAMPELRPQPARSEVIRASEFAIKIQKSRVARAKECILMLQAFGDHCGVCHALEGTLTDGSRHTTCLNRHGGNRKKLRELYDWNKPRVKHKPTGWTYNQQETWCWACSFPNSVLKEVGVAHEFRQCPWSDTMLGVAWIVWHTPALFMKMKETVPCNVDPPKGHSSGNSNLKWFTWLADLNKEQSSYNVYELWIWYFKARIEPSLDAGK